jgi:MoxR-like ATPase
MTNYPFYTGRGEGRRQGITLPGGRRSEQTRPQDYRPDQGLVDAANVALLLGQPLLLTGEPGTGKTQFAYSLAWELGLEPPLKFETKSTSVATDLFYYYDSLARFQASYGGQQSANALDYLTFNALGLAILRAADQKELATWLPSSLAGGEPRRSVVLVDEVDKAPRDFPNDILNEVEDMYFRIPELGNRLVRADPALQPILILTSNSEKNLPDPLLRRCAYYNIPFPEGERLVEIVEARLGKFAGRDQGFVDDALGLFLQLRDPASGLRKKPATAELLNWMVALRDIVPGAGNPLTAKPGAVEATVNILVKTAEDQDRAGKVVRQWLSERPTRTSGN